MKMIIPAIDISNGKCIRLSKGDFASKKEYDADPIETAMEFFSLGARRLHVVDLDAAFGRGNNRGLIGDICKAVPQCVVEVGGGIRKTSDVKLLRDMGVQILSLGTILIKDFFEVQHWFHTFGNVFSASLDMKDNRVNIAGWLQDTDISVSQFLLQCNKLQFHCINYTNINHDGMLAGADIDAANKVAEESSIPIVISGGVGTMDHIDDIMNKGHQNISGIIIGKAIYECTIDLVEVFKKYLSAEMV